MSSQIATAALDVYIIIMFFIKCYKSPYSGFDIITDFVSFSTGKTRLAIHHKSGL